MAMKIKIDSEVYKKIMHWVNKSQYEVSGFGNVLLEDDGTFRVISAVLTKQQNSAAETDIKAEDVSKALFECRETPGEMRWWWHSHVNMAVFWSQTDHQAMRDFASTPDAWMICTVFNKKNEMRSAYFAPQGCDTPFGKAVLLFDELPTSIEAAADQVAAWDAEYDAKVTNPTTYGKYWKASSRSGYQLTKKERKALKKFAKKVDDKFSVDEYGFTQEERSALTMNGWTLHDVDMLIERKFTPRQILMICEAGYLAEDIVVLMQQPDATIASVMCEVVSWLSVSNGNVNDSEETDIEDDLPVADRGRSSVIDMREGCDYRPFDGYQE